MKINSLFLWFSTSLLLIVASCAKTEISEPDKLDGNRISVLKAPDLDEHEWLAYILHDKTDFEMPTMRAEALVRNFANSGASTYSSGDEISVTTIRHLNPVTYSDTEHTGAYLVEFTSDGKEGYSLCSSDMRFEQIFAFVPEGSISDTVDNKALAGIIGNIDYIMRDSIEHYNALAEARYLSALQKIEAQMAEERERAEYKEKHTYFVIDNVTGAHLDENDGWHPYSNPNNPLDFRMCSFSYTDYSGSKNYDYIVPLKVKWNQTPPYNNLMPLAETGQYKYSNGRVAAGCVTIAVAQIMTYYKKGYNTNQWDAMTANKDLNNCSNAGIDAATKMIRFVYDGIGAKPGSTGTSAYTRSACNFLSDNKYDGSDTKDPDINAMYSSAVAKRLIYADGINPSNTNSAHAWIIDGVRKTNKSFKHYYDCSRPTGESYSKAAPNTKTYTEWYVSCNWGWGGSSDGWFLYDTFIESGYKGFRLTTIIYDLR
ncbi:MAG: C10 family peptidase [Rikenellaceae bacterium]|nr:C10 family peptidase [Rikenellaceae bacterium]